MKPKNWWNAMDFIHRHGSLVVCLAVLSTYVAAGQNLVTPERVGYVRLREVIGLGDYVAATAQLESLLVVQPEFPPGYAALQELCRYCGTAESADRILDRRFALGTSLGYTLFGRGLIKMYKCDFRQACVLFLRAITEGFDAPEVYSALAECYCKCHSIDQAIRYFTSLSHRNHRNANVWYGLALVYWEARNYTAFDRCLDRALSVDGNNIDFRQAKIAGHLLLGRFQEAIRLAESTLREAQTFSSLSSIGKISHSLAYSQIQLGRFREAEAVLNNGIALMSHFGFQGQLGWLSVLKANLCYLTGRYAEALHLSRSARVHSQAAGDSALGIECCIWEHQALTDLGMHDEGIVAACIGGMESLARSDGMQTMLSLVALSASLQELGMDSLSLDLAIESVSRLEKHAPDPYTRFLVQVRLADAYLAYGNVQAVLDLMPDPDRVVPIRLRTSSVATIAHGVLGNTFLRKGALSKAERHFRRQLDLARRQGFRREETAALSGMGGVMLAKGNSGAARVLFERCLEMPEGTLPVQLRLRTLSGIAESYLFSGESKSAEWWLDRATRECWQMLPKMDFDYRRNSLWGSYRRIVRRHVQVLIDLNRKEEAFSIAQRLTWSPIFCSPATTWMRETSVQGPNQHDSLRQMLEMCTAQYFAEYRNSTSLDRRLRSDHELAVSLATLRFSAETRSRLSVSRELAFDYLDTRDRFAAAKCLTAEKHNTRDWALVQFVAGQERTDIFVVGDSPQLHHVAVKMNDAAIRSELCQVLHAPGYGAIPEYAMNMYSMELDEGQNASISMRLLSPWMAFVQRKTRLIFLLDEALQSFPFELLVHPATVIDSSNRDVTGTYMIESFSVEYATSLSSDMRDDPRSDNLPQNFLAIASNHEEAHDVGEDDWGSYDEVSCVRTNVMANLPGVANELVAARNLPGFKVECLLGAVATLDRLSVSLSDADVVHIAAHSDFEGPGGLASTISLSAIGGRDDRILRAYDLVGIQSRAKMFVLSGCNTAGVVCRGELGQGFAGILHAVGVQSVVGTLWPVDDGSSATLMSNFYAGIAEGLDVAVALQYAKVKMIQEGNPDPYIWAGFVLLRRDFRCQRAGRDRMESRGEVDRPSGGVILLGVIFVVAVSMVIWLTSFWRGETGGRRN